jgi:hypothetical protein
MHSGIFFRARHMKRKSREEKNVTVHNTVHVHGDEKHFDFNYTLELPMIDIARRMKRKNLFFFNLRY